MLILSENIIRSIFSNTFDPTANGPEILPDSKGIYVVCLKNDAKFPSRGAKAHFKFMGENPVVYLGIGSSLRSRVFKNHFSGNNAGKSTLRKSLGVLFGYKQIPRDKDPTTGKTKFDVNDESNLTLWMNQSLVLFFTEDNNPDRLEEELVNYFDPPLNLLKVPGDSPNLEFRLFLKALRGQEES